LARDIANVNNMSPTDPPLEPRFLRAAIDLITAALKPFADLEVDEGRTGTIRIRVRATPRLIRGIVLRPWPANERARTARDARTVLWVTHRTDAATRETLRNQDASFIDVGTRTVRLHLPGLVLVDRGAVRVERAPRTWSSQRSPFSDLASLVTRSLLAEPGRDWTLTRLSARAGVSTALASRIVEHLSSASLVRAERTGRTLEIRLDDPWPLFLRWTGSYRWTENVALHVAAPVGEPRRFLARLDALLRGRRAGRRWALTLHAGASLLGTHATWETVHAYVACRTEAELAEFARRIGWEPSPQGRLVMLAPKYRRSVWWGLTGRERGDPPAVHTIQLMLDLWHYPVRGREQAEHLARTLGWRSIGK